MKLSKADRTEMMKILVQAMLQQGISAVLDSLNDQGLTTALSRGQLASVVGIAEALGADR